VERGHLFYVGLWVVWLDWMMKVGHLWGAQVHECLWLLLIEFMQ